ncbi:MAG: aminotransferase class IV, partial [Myxococcales bacterium]
VTPPLALGMLQGVTRTVVLEVARGEGLIVREEPFGPEALAAADEVFVTSTIREIMPVTALLLLGGPSADVRRIGDGKQGPVTHRLHEAFRRYVGRTHGA